MYFGFYNVSAAYGKRTVLENVTLEVKRGSITAIIGPNGCGKSSLLKTVMRTVVPASGHVEFKERPLTDHPRRELSRSIAYLPQMHTSPPDIDVTALVSYGRYPHRTFGRGLTPADREIIDETIRMTGLDGLRHRELSRLSGGERQRAWLAMAVCQRPEVLILDEPTTFLDIGCQIEVLELIKELRGTLGMTVLTVLHDINLAARFCDTIAALHDRRLYALGRPDEVVTSANMEALFGFGGVVGRDEVNGCPYFIPVKNK